MNKRIAYAIDGPFIGGGHLHMLGLAEAARAHGYHVEIICSAPGPFPDMVRDREFNVHFLRMGKLPSAAIRNSWQSKIAELKPDLLHLHGGVAGFWGRGATRGMPLRVVYTIHGIHFIHNPSFWVRQVSLFMERLMRRDTVDVICVCESDKRRAIDLKIATAGQITVIHNGIDLRIKARPKSPGEGGVIAIVGRLVRMKGQKFAIEAMPAILREHPSALLQLIGDGVDRAALEALVEKLSLKSTVHFLGHQDDVAGVLAGVDIFLMPSLWEGQPLALMEAMRAGLPIVVSNVDGIPEVVRNEVEALLVPAADPAAIASGVLRLINDKSLASRLSIAAARRVAMFDETICFEKTIQVYQRATAGIPNTPNE